MDKVWQVSVTGPPSKTDLLKFTYNEVLDATKHQDEKIGRFLTAIAFLTATSFAMAGLDQGRFIFQTFRLGNQVAAHFGLYSLAAFLLGVIGTVLVLMTSFATQLRFPNIERLSDHTSIVYFAEISQTPLTEWVHRWDETSPKWISDDRDAHFTKETHNLSIRAKTKYDRLREAASIFSLALLAYAVSILFVVFAAARTDAANLPKQQVPALMIDLRIRIALWIVFIVFMLIQFYSGYQALNHDIEELEKNLKTNRLSKWIYLTLMVSVSALSLSTGEGVEKFVLILVLIVCLGAYCALTYRIKIVTKVVVTLLDGKLLSKEVLSKNREVLWIALQFFVSCLLIFCLFHRDTYRLQFIYCFLLIAAVVSRSGLDALFRTRRQQRDVAKAIKEKNAESKCIFIGNDLQGENS